MNKYIWALIESGTTVVFQFLSLIILSHLLSPFDYGVFGAMALFISVGNILADSGMGAALVKKENPTDVDYSTLFCFNISVSFLYYVVLFVLSSFIADFYNIEQLALCIKVYGIYVIIASLGLIQNIQLNREFRLRELSIVTLISSFIGLFIAIIMGYWGYGYWSLIFQHLVFITSRVFFQFFYNRYIPQINFSIVSFKEQFSYSVNLLGANILNVIYSNIASMIIPKIGTLKQNGYYIQASKIQYIPMAVSSSILDKVLFPVLSRHQGEEFLIIARKQIFHISWIAALVCLLILLLSKPLILLLLGNEWITTADYLQILMLASYGMIYQYVIRSLFKAKGLTLKIFKINLVKNILGLTIIFIASSWGVDVLLWGLVVGNLFITVLYALQAKRGFNYILFHQLRDNVCMIVLFLISLIIVVV